MGISVVQQTVVKNDNNDIKSFFMQKSCESIPKKVQTQTNDNGLDLFLSDTVVLDKQVYNLVNSNKAAGILFKEKTVTGHKKLWEFKTSGKIRSSPVVHNGIVYAGNDNGDAYAINSNNGTLIWSVKVKDKGVLSSFCYHDDAVYTSCSDSKVYALNIKDGSKLWEFKTGKSSIYSSPVVDNGVLYIGSTDKKIYAVNAKDGKQKWSFKTKGSVFSTPVVAGGLVYIGSDDGKLYALNANDGNERWSFQTENVVRSSPVISNNMLYLASADNHMYALNAQYGGPVWSFKPAGRGGEFTSPSFNNGIVYAGNRNGKVYAHAASRDIWQFYAGGEIFSSVLLDDNTVYVGSIDKKVYALDANDGRKLWEFVTGDKVVCTPVMHDGILYIGSDDGNLYALTNKVDMIINNGLEDLEEVESQEGTPKIQFGDEWVIVGETKVKINK